MSRARLLLLLAVLVLSIAPSAEAATYRACSGGDAANGVSAVRVLRTTCSEGLAVARRTNAVKCFLNGSRCTHRFRGRSWTCSLADGERVRCVAGRRHVRYRVG
jgi:hypothetical protein